MKKRAIKKYLIPWMMCTLFPLTACGKAPLSSTGPANNISTPSPESTVSSDDAAESDDAVKNDNSVKNDDAIPTTYLKFLKGEAAAIAADWYTADGGYSGANIVKKGQEYTLKQLADLIRPDGIYQQENNRQEELGKETEFALLDSGDDGTKELAVRLNHVGIDGIGQDDTSSTTLIMKETGGKLFLWDSFDNWSRSETTQYYYGFRDGAGSAGAGDHVYDQWFINGEGSKQHIYNDESLFDFWISFVNDQAIQEYNAIYDGEYPEGITMDIFTVGDQKYYSYGSYEPEKAPDEGEQGKMLKTLISCFNDQGIQFSSLDEIHEKIKDRKQELGIKESWCVKKELEWRLISDLNP